MKRIVITGAGGFVGSYVVEKELANGNYVIGIDLAPPTKVQEFLDNKNFLYVQEDILKEGVLEAFLKNVDILYHFAAIADPSVYCDNPLRVLQVDLEGSQRAIRLAYEYDIKIIFSSTSEVYGKNPNVPWEESDDRILGSTDKSRWSYSTAKAAGEHYCYAYGKKGLRFVILRFFNFYGPKLDFIGGGRVMTCFLEKFFKGEPVEVVEPGSQTRCFTYIADGVRAVCDAAHSKEAEGLSLNIGAKKEVAIMYLAQIMKIVGGFSSEIVRVPASQKFGSGYDDILRRVPNTDRIYDLLGWKPTVSLDDGLKRTIDYFRRLECASQ